MTFDEVCENYPDWLANVSDEVLTEERNGDWDGSTWEQWQRDILIEMVDAEVARRTKAQWESGD